MMSEQKDRLDLLIKQVFERMKKQGSKPAICPDAELLAAYREGSLEKEERERLEEHLAFCNECADSLLFFAEAQSSYAYADETYTTNKMLKNAKALIETREKTSLWDRISPWFTPFRLRPVAVMASIVLVVMVYGLFRLQVPSPDIPLPAGLSLMARVHSRDLARGAAEEYREVEIQDGGVLHSGDLIKVTFELREEAYVYLLSLDSSGRLSRLFPKQDAWLHQRFKAGQVYHFPEKGKWLELDQNTGQERIYLIASKDPIEKIDRKIDELKTSGIDKINEIFPNARIQSFRFEHKQILYNDFGKYSEISGGLL